MPPLTSHPQASAELIPPYMRPGILNYLVYGLEPGSFFYCILTNNLIEATQRADENNITCLHHYAAFLYRLPRSCWGSPKAVTQWQAARSETPLSIRNIPVAFTCFAPESLHPYYVSPKTSSSDKP